MFVIVVNKATIYICADLLAQYFYGFVRKLIALPYNVHQI